MEYRIPKEGEIYRHFKGDLYEIIIIARDSETLEKKVVYKEIEGDAVYVRSLPMFCNDFDIHTEDHSMIMGFLDLHTINEKIQYLQNAKEHITEEFIEVVAQSLDFTENAVSLSERYQAILQYLMTVKKYEGERFR